MDSPDGSETVLVVDDDPTTRLLVRQVLEESGYTVLEAATGDEAIRVAERDLEAIDLIICDVVLPQTVGPMVVKRLTALRPEIKVLFISGLTEVRTYGLTDANYLKKPFEPVDLIRKVQEVLVRRE